MNLMSGRQVEYNLRRTMNKGLVSILNPDQLEQLAFKYFGVKNNNGEIIGYQCPYSGKIYYDYSNIVLEHIIPVASGGGTILFNCIPTSDEINGSDEKGTKHLLEWWLTSKYWDNNALERLEKIVNYILDAYNLTFNEYTFNTVEDNSCENKNETFISVEDDLAVNERENSSKNLTFQIYSYLSFLNDCIKELEKNKVDTTSIKERLSSLQNQGVFQNINEYQMYQNIIQKLIISKIGDDNRAYLSYTLNFNIQKLIDSVNLLNENEIYKELESRLNYIESLLKEKGLSLTDYFKSMKSIYHLDIIYKSIDQISSNDQKKFLKSIKLGTDSKIENFINMLNEMPEQDLYDFSNNLLSQKNIKTFSGHDNQFIGSYWVRKKSLIKAVLSKLENLNPGKYSHALDIINKYEQIQLYQHSIKIDLFIEMLNNISEKSLEQATTNIFSNQNILEFNDENHSPVRAFWHNNQAEINQRLLELELESPQSCEHARRMISLNQNRGLVVQKYGNVIPKINIFIEMLNELSEDALNNYETNIFSKNNTQTFKGYPNIALNNFWNTRKNAIKKQLTKLEKTVPGKYTHARKIIEKYEISCKTNSQKRADIFIEMLNSMKEEDLNNPETNIFNPKNAKKFLATDIYIKNFWNSNHSKVKQRLTLLASAGKKDYTQAFKMIEKYEKHDVSNARQNKVKLFIEMLNTMQPEDLNDSNKNIFKNNNALFFNDNSKSKVGAFWQNNKGDIKSKLSQMSKEYDNARKIIKLYEYQNRDFVKERIDNFIEMANTMPIEYLDEEERNILRPKNSMYFTKEPNVKIGYFWQNNNQAIKSRLKDLDPETYAHARKIIDTYEISTKDGIAKRIELFIEMLNHMPEEHLKDENLNILNAKNNQSFTGFPKLKINCFWPNNKIQIIKLLFENDFYKSNENYNHARNIILRYCNVINYETLKEKMNLAKLLEEDKVYKKTLEYLNQKADLEISNTEQRRMA